MPPKKKSTATESCCVCCQQITLGKDEALYCEGSCKQWLHRYCPSVSINQYKTISESKSPFQCPTCYREYSKQQIKELCDAVTDLKLELGQLKSALNAVVPEPSSKQTPDPPSTAVRKQKSNPWKTVQMKRRDKKKSLPSQSYGGANSDILLRPISCQIAALPNCLSTFGKCVTSTMHVKQRAKRGRVCVRGANESTLLLL